MTFRAAALASLLILAAGSVEAVTIGPIRNELQNRITRAQEEGHLRLCSERACSSAALPVFYQRRDWKPAWITASGLSSQADHLLRAIEQSQDDGLIPSDYHPVEIERALAQARRNGDDPVLWATVDLLMTDAFLYNASHRRAGRVDPFDIDPNWCIEQRRLDYAALLESALEDGQVAESLRRMAPRHDGYTRLRDALRSYRDVAGRGGWQRIPDGPAIRPGDRDPRVNLIRQRLGSATRSGDAFDTPLQQLVRQFQRDHGLEPDAIVGSETLAEMNVPVESRIEQILLNLERWRWMPDDLGATHVMVNIADFTLVAVRDGRRELEMRTVVGKEYHSTPVFSDAIRTVVLNPYWNVPAGIAADEILPAVKKDRSYLARERFEVLRGDRVIAPASVDWRRQTADSLNVRFRQRPGPDNALGRIKFLFPNKFNVYLHDTPAKSLFEKHVRTFSHGCIRVERPVDLAAFLLSRHGWPGERLEREIATSSDERVITLPTPVPVHILYFTAWVEEGRMQFRRDIYGRDARLRRAMF